MWTYVEGANQAHFKFRDPRRSLAAGPLSVEQLAKWLQWAQGDRAATATDVSIGMAKRLVALLGEDLFPDEVLWSVEDAGSDMHANIYMSRASDNRYFALELWWSED
ncbi:hypothetical protein NU688_03600 [Variovorax sp. ZS18.2.2]|uniref:hypothetical protein n=1 Tax=Variovorax sp. ZS18.2.2 TaxID=2971255 RepID=UPI002151A692|nr:hypothetical protein [Variovorax sp. ZS18.2.2]MCR6475232.1 hypothetical protein [Variovorax sp. ZS18.2.2]